MSITTGGKSIVEVNFSFRLPHEARIRQGQDIYTASALLHQEKTITLVPLHHRLLPTMRLNLVRLATARGS